MRRDVAASPRRGSHRLSLLTVPRAASREAHCQADRGINLSAVESRKLVDRKYCFIAIGDLFTEKISHAQQNSSVNVPEVSYLHDDKLKFTLYILMRRKLPDASFYLIQPGIPLHYELRYCFRTRENQHGSNLSPTLEKYLHS